MTFKDHFSGHAGGYAAARPGYPRELFAWLASLCAMHDLAWDCGTGSGQAAVAQRYRRERGHDPLAWLESEIAACWNPDEVREVSWPMFLLAGQNQ